MPCIWICIKNIFNSIFSTWILWGRLLKAQAKRRDHDEYVHINRTRHVFQCFDWLRFVYYIHEIFINYANRIATWIDAFRTHFTLNAPNTSKFIDTVTLFPIRNKINLLFGAWIMNPFYHLNRIITASEHSEALRYAWLAFNALNFRLSKWWQELLHTEKRIIRPFFSQLGSHD